MNETIKKSIGKRLEYIRLSKMHMNKREFANLIDVHEQNIGKIERGMIGLSLEKLFLIHDRLGVSADYLLFGEENIKETRNIKKVITDVLLNYKGQQLDFAMEIVKSILNEIDNV